MVLKSKKSKSKRSTLRHKYKVIKKVKEHLKKKTKEEKKKRKAGIKPKGPKDPGIPAQWPFKEQLLKDLEWQKQRILAQEKVKKEQKKLKRVSEDAILHIRLLSCFRLKNKALPLCRLLRGRMRTWHSKFLQRPCRKLHYASKQSLQPIRRLA